MEILNIGLKVKGKGNLNIVYVLRDVQKFANIINYRVEQSEYMGEEEPVLIIQVEKISNGSLRNLCVLLNQECIAILRGQTGTIVYRPSFKGKRITFDLKYFKNFS